MGQLFHYIASGMGYIISSIYNITGNYGIAIILFTVIVKILMLPLSIKQYKSTMEMQEIQPLVANLQNKYKNDPNKLNEQIAKIYSERKINPFAGCLLLFVQLPILWAVFMVIQKPVTYMLRQNIVIPGTDVYKEVYYAVNHQLLNFNFGFLDLGQIPTFNKPLLWIIPILAGVTTYLASKMSMSSQSMSPEQGAMQKNMMTIFPVMTAYLTFLVPAGMGLYWLVSNVTQIIQQNYINQKMGLKKKEVSVE